MCVFQTVFDAPPWQVFAKVADFLQVIARSPPPCSSLAPPRAFHTVFWAVKHEPTHRWRSLPAADLMSQGRDMSSGLNGCAYARGGRRALSTRHVCSPGRSTAPCTATATPRRARPCSPPSSRSCSARPWPRCARRFACPEIPVLPDSCLSLIHRLRLRGCLGENDRAGAAVS